MRRWTRFLPLLLAGMAAVADASPSPLVGELRLRVFHDKLHPLQSGGRAGDLLVNGSFGASVATPHLSTLTVPASAFQTANLIVDVTDPQAAPIDGLRATLHNQAGLFSDTGGGFGGVMALAGAARVCLFADCNAAFVPANLELPLAVVGVGGAEYVTGLFINITVMGAPWTTGTVNVGTVTQMGFLHAPGSGTSSTGLNGGVVSLVTPVFVSTSIPGGLSFIPTFGLLSLLRVIPEPATLLLVAGGLAALGLGRRRLRRR